MFVEKDSSRLLTGSPICDALRRLAAEPRGDGVARHDETAGPADLMSRAADEIDALRDALFWCSGSPSFGPEGEAHGGWMMICAPLIDGIETA